MIDILKIIEYIFGFTECAKCKKLDKCDRKPYLHNEADCNYRKIHGGTEKHK